MQSGVLQSQIQLDLGINSIDLVQKNTIKKKRIHNEIPTYLKNDKIKDNLKKWNTIPHIYRYQTFYKICSALYLLTYNNQLECLDYYVDIENDGSSSFTVMYAEIYNTSALSIKDRVLEHIKLLKRVKNNEIQDDERDIKKIDSDVVTLFG